MVMANIYMECGKYDEAINELDYLLALETVYTVNDIILNPTFDPLKENPTFQKVIDHYRLTPDRI
jgi:hypothetical protein